MRSCRLAAPAAHTFIAGALLLATAASHSGEMQAGRFRFPAPPSFAAVSGPALDRLQQSAQSGAARLAERSGLADPNAAGDLGAAFFHAFRTGDGRLTLIFQGVPLAEPADVDEMLGASRERVSWGVSSGQLLRASAVSRQQVDGVSCILQDIAHSRGARLRNWLCFPPDRPWVQVSMSVICEAQIDCDRHRTEIDTLLGGIRLRSR